MFTLQPGICEHRPLQVSIPRESPQERILAGFCDHYLRHFCSVHFHIPSPGTTTKTWVLCLNPNNAQERTQRRRGHSLLTPLCRLGAASGGPLCSRQKDFSHIHSVALPDRPPLAVAPFSRIPSQTTGAPLACALPLPPLVFVAWPLLCRSIDGLADPLFLETVSFLKVDAGHVTLHQHL